MGVSVSKEIVRTAVTFDIAVRLIACSTAAAVQKQIFPSFPLENRLDVIAAARSITQIGMLEVNCDNSTHTAREEVWFVP